MGKDGEVTEEFVEDFDISYEVTFKCSLIHDGQQGYT